MTDYDVWLVHQYFSVYFSLYAEDEDMAYRLIEQALQEEGLPMWLFSDARDITIEPKGVLV